MTTAPYPHFGGCEQCRELGVCNHCGTPTSAARGRCTNGRCRKCCSNVCTAGGDVAPGHGYGQYAGKKHFEEAVTLTAADGSCTI